jgi:uncharacterized membrane protein YphA (DoxX/SURF4 family)
VSQSAGASFAGGPVQSWASTLVRVALAGVLFAASLLKIADPRQAAQAVQAYQILPVQLAEYVGYGLPLVELGLGVLLLLGLGTRLAALATGALMTAFVVGVASAWWRGLSIDCGCFGGGGAVPQGEAVYWPVIARDLLFVGMSAWLVGFPASRLALDPSGRAGTGGRTLYELEDDDDGDIEDQKRATAAADDPTADAEDQAR